MTARSVLCSLLAALWILHSQRGCRHSASLRAVKCQAPAVTGLHCHDVVKQGFVQCALCLHLRLNG